MTMPSIFDPPTGARKMAPEFARRIRSFIRGAEWSAILGSARNDLGSESLAQIVLAGVTGYTNEDLRFAEAIDWSVPRRDLDATNVVTADYAGGNWWYIDPDQSIGNAKVGIWGVVRVQLSMEPGDTKETRSARAKANAKAFAKAMLDDDRVAGAKVTFTPDSEDGYYNVVGQIWLT